MSSISNSRSSLLKSIQADKHRSDKNQSGSGLSKTSPANVTTNGNTEKSVSNSEPKTKDEGKKKNSSDKKKDNWTMGVQGGWAWWSVKNRALGVRSDLARVREVIGTGRSGYGWIGIGERG